MRRIFIAISARLVPETMIDLLLASALRQAAALPPGGDGPGGVWTDLDGVEGPARRETAPSRLFL